MNVVDQRGPEAYLHLGSDGNNSTLYRDIGCKMYGGRLLQRQINYGLKKTDYRQISNIGHTEFQNLNVSHLVLQLYLCNILKPGVKLRIKI